MSPNRYDVVGFRNDITFDDVCVLLSWWCKYYLFWKFSGHVFL